MADDPRAQEQAVNDTPQAPMPSAEQQTQPEAETKVQAPVETVDSSQHAKEQFERLREQLRTEKEKRLYYENVFANIQAQQKPVPQPEVKLEPPSIYDPNTGLINEKAFEAQRREIDEAKKAAIDAQRQAQQARQEAEAWRRDRAKEMQNKEEEEAFKAYPQLDYKNEKTLDKEFHRSVRAVLLDSMVNPQDYGGKQLTYKAAADLAKGSSKQVIDNAKAEGAKTMVEKITPKEQASLDVEPGNAGNRSNIVDMDDEAELSRRTRKGDLEAIVARMRRIKS